MSILDRFQSKLSFNFNEHPELLLEIAKKTLLGNTDAGRIARSKTQVRTQPVSALLLDEKRRLWMLEYNFRAYPSTEEKRHWGYVIYDMNNDDVMELFCDCKDWFYRLYAPMVKNRLGRWSMNNKYMHRLVRDDRGGQHNHKWTKVTNPEGRLFVCKHMAAALEGYVGPEVEPAEKPTKRKPLLPPNAIKKIPGGKIKEREPLVKEPEEKKIDRRFKKPEEQKVTKPLAGVHIDKRFKQKKEPPEPTEAEQGKKK